MSAGPGKLENGGRPMADDIMALCQRGDSHAFARLVRSNQDYAFALAFRMLTDQDEARDVVQEAFIRVWKNIGRYEPTQKFTTWLYAIVSRLCLDRLRSRSRPTRFFRMGGREDPLPELADTTDPETLLTNREIGTIIARLSQELSPTQRLVFTLRDLQECTVKEVCDITGLSEGSVKANLSYARRNIRHWLVQQYQITGSES